MLRESPLIRAHFESGESSLTQRCIGLHLLPLLERYSRPLLTEKHRIVKHLPLQPRREMAHLFTTADTVMSGSHLWSTPPDIGRRGREENRSELGREDPNNSPFARVMSPNTQVALASSPPRMSTTHHLMSSPPRVANTTQLALRSNDEYSGSFDVANVGQVYCQDCNTPVSCLFVCAGCGIYGHTQCLRLEKFFDYLFCPPCLQKAAGEFAAIQDAQRRVEWRNRLAQQILGWRSRVTEAIGMSSTVGIAVGGAMVAVAGVAAGLAHGVVRGAAVGSNISQFALPGINDDQASTAYQSAGDLSEVPSAHAGRLLEDARDERENVTTTRRRVTCHACWNPQLGNLRLLLSHLLC